MRPSTNSRHVALLWLDRRYHVAKRMVLVALALTVLMAGVWLLHVLAANGGDHSGREWARTYMIVVFGAALSVGATAIVLLETRVAPAVMCLRYGSNILVLAMSVRRPALLARVGDLAEVTTTRKVSIVRSPLLGRVEKVYYFWTITARGCRIEWTMGDPMPRALARMWSGKLEGVGLVSAPELGLKALLSSI